MNISRDDESRVGVDVTEGGTSREVVYYPVPSLRRGGGASNSRVPVFFPVPSEGNTP